MEKQISVIDLEDKNSIKFNCSGAIDFDEQINIELSLTKKDGFIEITPLNLMWEINKMKHIQHIIYVYFYKIVKRIPHISDRNEDLPKDKRFTEIFYKCYRRYHHSHEPYGKYHYTDLTLEDAIKHIQKGNFGILLPN